MEISFTKYHGAGNDFIMIDDSALCFPLSDSELIASMCHRRFGIGADGLIVLQQDKQYDFKMSYFNSDGLEGSMCGNGGRCAAKFANELGWAKHHTCFMAIDGVHYADILENGTVKLRMNDVNKVMEKGDYYFVNTGSPHVLIVVDDIDSVDVVGLGRRIREDKQNFPEGTNVNFIGLCGSSSLKLRTYERGVEDETWACGTGSVASAVFCAFLNDKTGSQSIDLQTKGGKLVVDFDYDGKSFTNIYLTGPAESVFSGKYSTV